MSKKTVINTAGSGEKKYGLFSLLALIVGVVIGSGIFVKNDAVYGATGSAVYSLITWGIVSFIILLMVFAFVEIASSGKKTGKPGTLSGWLSDFISPKLGKIIGIYIMFVYFPSLIAAMPQWGADTILGEAAPGLSAWESYGATFGIALLILGFVMFLNIRSQKGSKLFGTAGMGIKVLPLLTVIIAGIVFMAIGQNGSGTDPGFPVDAPENLDGKSMFEGMLLAMPAILFAFDGFVYSASMQNEAKDQKTFMMAWVGGMIFVIAIYIMYSMMIFVSAPATDLTLTGAITNVFGAETAKWLAPLMQSFVIISITTGLNGNFINASKTMSSISSEDIISDKNGTLLKYNREQNPQYSTYLLMGVTLIWFLVLRGLDAAVLGIAQGTGSFMAATNFITDFGAVINFFLYSMVMVAGVTNRKTNKVEVETKWYFVPAAVIASAGILFISGYQVYNIFAGLFTNAAESWYQFVVLALMVGGTVGAYFILERQTKKMTPKDWKAKEKAKKAYFKQEVAAEFLEGHKPFKVR